MYVSPYRHTDVTKCSMGHEMASSKKGIFSVYNVLVTIDIFDLILRLDGLINKEFAGGSNP